MNFTMRTEEARMSDPRIGEPISTAVNASSELLDELWLEYKRLIDTLKRQRRCRDVALEMRLRVVMMDLGLYQPSPP